MIKCENNEVTIKGNTIVIATELTLIVKSFKKMLEEKNDAECVNGLIMKTVKLGLMSQEEFDKEYEETAEKLKNRLFKKFINDLL